MSQQIANKHRGVTERIECGSEHGKSIDKVQLSCDDGPVKRVVSKLIAGPCQYGMELEDFTDLCLISGNVRISKMYKVGTILQQDSNDLGMTSLDCSVNRKLVPVLRIDQSLFPFQQFLDDRQVAGCGCREQLPCVMTGLC